MSSSRSLKGEYQKVVLACLNKNAFFVHSGNLLVAMAADKYQEMRRRALDLISWSSGPKKEQNFVLPQVNSIAQDYIELINVDNKLATSPLLKGTANQADIEQEPLQFGDNDL